MSKAHWLTSRRVSGILLALLVIGAAYVAINLHRRGHTTGDDWALYVRMAKSLFEGNISDVISDNRFLFDHSTAVTPPIYPWGWPLLLAPFVILFGIIMIMISTDTPLGFGRLLLLGTFSLGIGLFIPLLALQIRANQMRKKILDQFPVALDVFVRGLRAGHPVAAALDLLTVEMPDPIGSQFGLVVDEVTYGADLRDALQSMAERWDSADMRMFVVSLSVQAETGGNLAEVLDNLAKVIRERQSLMLKVRALSSEGRMTAIILTALPVLAFTTLFTLNPPFYLDVADDRAFVPGFVSLILLYIVGFVAIRRMVDIKV